MQARVHRTPFGSRLYLWFTRPDHTRAYASSIEDGTITWTDVPEGHEGLYLFEVRLGIDETLLTALASALVEHAPAQSATTARLEATQEALDIANTRLDRIIGSFLHPEAAYNIGLTPDRTTHGA